MPIDYGQTNYGQTTLRSIEKIGGGGGVRCGMKKWLLTLIKILLAIILAIVILSVILIFYYHLPLHSENTDGITDYKWSSNAYWVKMTEGVSVGRFDANGFNNTEVIDKPNIIIVGSSHMEATNVFPSENICTLINTYYNGKLKAYNLGISGHNFKKICQYLPKVLEKYSSSQLKYIIMETSTVDITEEDLHSIIDSSVEHTQSYDKGIIAFLQKSSFFRLLYAQYSNGLLKLFLGNENPQPNETVRTEFCSETTYSELFNYLSSIQKNNNVQMIIFYHPTSKLNKDGTISFATNDETLKLFSDKALSNNICFIDMTSNFENMYYKEHKLANGFFTGRIGEGHLNAYGHKIIANRIISTINKLEENK